MGIYTDIVEIVAPASALAGEIVDIQVKIKNTYPSPIGILVGGALEYGVEPWPMISYPTRKADVAGGATHVFFGSFTMPYYPPGKVITIHAYSYYYGVDGFYHFDDEETKDVVTASGPSVPDADIADLDFVVTPGTYDIGDIVPFTLTFKYKGMAQSVNRTISLGTGVPPFFATKYTYAVASFPLSQSLDWAIHSLPASLIMPSGLVAGQTYSVRAQLETSTDYTQETDTDWGVITIREEVPVEPAFSQLIIASYRKA